MPEIKMTIPDEALASVGATPDEASAQLRMLAAVKLFEMKKLSSGAAARLAGIPRTVFLQKLGDYGIDTFQLTGEEIDRETPLA